MQAHNTQRYTGTHKCAHTPAMWMSIVLRSHALPSTTTCRGRMGGSSCHASADSGGASWPPAWRSSRSSAPSVFPARTCAVEQTCVRGRPLERTCARADLHEGAVLRERADLHEREDLRERAVLHVSADLHERVDLREMESLHERADLRERAAS